MNGPHDMGGMHGFGPVLPEEDEPVFHKRWEARVYGMSAAMRRHSVGNNIDYRRHLIELLPPPLYLNSSYYERWFERLLGDCARKGILSEDELHLINQGHVPPASSAAASPSQPAAPAPHPGGYKRPIDTPAAFKVGDDVRGRNINPSGHTRLPRYARGKRGVVTADHGGFVFPDSNAALEGECPQRLYTVRFTARELWGEDVNAKDTVSLDLWESYLERAV
jgi:nitrile hydratase